MASSSSSSSPSPLILFTLLIIVTAAVAAAAKPNLNLVTDVFDFESAAMSLAAGEFTDGGDQLGRRSLFWKAMRYYISYGALSANRIPCPPRSGRSYYTHNCFNARGPVHPYTRGCSTITRCRR